MSAVANDARVLVIASMAMGNGGVSRCPRARAAVAAAAWLFTPIAVSQCLKFHWIWFVRSQTWRRAHLARRWPQTRCNVRFSLARHFGFSASRLAFGAHCEPNTAPQA